MIKDAVIGEAGLNSNGDGPDGNLLQTATILIVDDIEVNRRLLDSTFRQENYRLLHATGTAQALDVIASEHVDLVIVDMIMPEMDGLECCRRIKADRRTELIPILMVSCMPGVDHEIAGIVSGADEYLARPFNSELLRTRVRSLLRHK
jgi:DNA-binding response OmpR family regulator